MKKLIIYIVLFISSSMLFAQNNKVVLKINETQNKTKSETLNDIKNLTLNALNKLEQFHKPSYKKSLNRVRIQDIYVLHVKDDKSIDAVIKNLKSLKGIEYVEAYPISYIYEEPDDPYLLNQYYLYKTKALEAHDISKGDTNIVIGIVDSGVDLLHEDLKENYKYNYNDPINNIDDDGDTYVDNFYGWDVANGDNNPQSEVNFRGEVNYHGTKVAGTAAATTNNGLGIASMGYNTKILPIKAMDGSGIISAGYEGIMYAATHGCQIINLSWGNNTYSHFAQDVINYVTEEYGCLIVAAAGNRVAASDKRPDTWFYPASYDNIFSVAATGSADNRWSGSSYAITVDVSAPGQAIFSTKQFSTYGAGNGTSYAAPLVSGLAALLKAHKPELTHKQLAEQIRITSDYIDTLPENIYYSKQLGYGRVNALRALSIDNLPSVRIDSFKIDCNDTFFCDTLAVSFIATNYLAQATNTTIKLNCNSDFIIPINNVLQTGEFATFAQISNTTSPFLFEVLDELPYNEKVWFEFEIYDQGYNDYQIFETVIKKDYINVSSGNIKTTLTSNGKIGYTNWNKELGIGIEFKGNNLISNAGIILGSSPENMVSALFEKEEFEKIKIIDTASTKDGLMGTDILRPLPASNLDIEVKHKVLFPNDVELSNTIIHTYTLSNTSNSNIYNLKLSQFLDWDLSHPTYNMVEFIDELNLAYTYSRTSNVIYSAICLLNDLDATPYAFDMTLGGNGGIDITQGFNNDLKWFTMNNNREQAGNEGDSIDIASMLTTDFFSINSMDSFEVAFAHIIGTNLIDITAKADKLIEEYNKPISINHSENIFVVYPNPTNGIAYINTKNNNAGLIKIYSTVGQIMRSQPLTKGRATAVDVSGLSSGIYIIHLTQGSRSSSTKLTITY